MVSDPIRAIGLLSQSPLTRFNAAFFARNAFPLVAGFAADVLGGGGAAALPFTGASSGATAFGVLVSFALPRATAVWLLGPAGEEGERVAQDPSDNEEAAV